MTSSYFNDSFIFREVTWLKQYIDFCLKQQEEGGSLTKPEAPVLIEGDRYGELIRQYNMNEQERLVLALALAPHIQPSILDAFIKTHNDTGGKYDSIHKLFLPTGQTALFLLAGDDLAHRFEAEKLFEKEHFFAKETILKIKDTEDGFPRMCGELCISEEFRDRIVLGIERKPKFSQSFPAKELHTSLGWEDLVLPQHTLQQIRKVLDWMEYGEKVIRDLKLQKIIRKGYKGLFYGPPGTGKSLTAALLGKHTGREVYRIDLSMVVSKYIGETEKNLSAVFERAENKDWILFFDEADALFSKRTSVNNSNDRYANQETAFLLQRVEEFDGLVILASNMKENLDQAFTRRFQSVIYFPMPRPKERYELWKNSFSPVTQLSNEISLEQVAEKYEIAGGSIINVVRDCSVTALKRGDLLITMNDLEKAIRDEFAKENKIV